MINFNALKNFRAEAGKLLRVPGLLAGDLVELLYPRICLACNNRLADNLRSYVCAECRGRIKKNIPPFCRTCGRTLEAPSAANANICQSCSRFSPDYDRALSPCLYDGVVKSLILQFKYQGKDYLAAYLAGLLTDFLLEYGTAKLRCDCVIPMPLHSAKQRERGFNQALLLAKPAAEALDIPLVSNCLRRVRLAQPQAELEQELRRENVKGCFKAVDNGLIERKKILLVDDVLTTGSTCSEAARVLKENGALAVYVLTLAN